MTTEQINNQQKIFGTVILVREKVYQEVTPIEEGEKAKQTRGIIMKEKKSSVSTGELIASVALVAIVVYAWVLILTCAQTVH